VSGDDWFRGTAWDRKTRETFEKKLEDARSERAQYLRIKGLELTGSAKKSARRAGRELLLRVLTEHPDDRLQVTMAHADLAESLAREGDLIEAANHYQHAMDGEGNVVTLADLGLVEVILQAEWVERYDEALNLLLKSEASKDPFPATRFRWNLAAAKLASRRGESSEARELAKLALRCLEETESPFPRHRHWVSPRLIARLYKSCVGSRSCSRRPLLLCASDTALLGFAQCSSANL
jgi:tetratricopeptide (TPR) repeat protein